MIQFDEHIFQMGWNHHRDELDKRTFGGYTLNIPYLQVGYNPFANHWS